MPLSSLETITTSENMLMSKFRHHLRNFKDFGKPDLLNMYEDFKQIIKYEDDMLQIITL